MTEPIFATMKHVIPVNRRKELEEKGHLWYFDTDIFSHDCLLADTQEAYAVRIDGEPLAFYKSLEDCPKGKKILPGLLYNPEGEDPVFFIDENPTFFVRK